MKKILVLFLSLFLLFSCNSEKNKINENEIKDTEKITITSSIVPISSIVNYIGGENFEVKNIVPAGVSPHSFDLKTSDLVNLEKTQGIIVVGLEHIDGFLDKATSEKNVLKLASDMELLDAGEHHNHKDEHSEEHDEDEHHHENSESDEHEIEHDKNLEKEHHEDENGHEDDGENHNDKHEHEHNHEKDPHVWNSPKNAKIIAIKISKFLSEIKPEKKEAFEKNTKDFSDKIDNIKKNFLEKIKEKKQGHFIVFHDAYNYLFQELGIDTEKKLVFRTSVLNEPNSNDMKKIIDEIKEHDIKVAFIEPQFKNGNLEKLASEYDIKIFVLDPLGQDKSKNGYLQNLENNLQNLENIYE